LGNVLVRGGARAWGIWFCAAAFVFLELYARVIPGVFAGEIEKDLNFGPAVLGESMGLYYLTYAPLQLVAGVLVDRWGCRRVLPGAALIAALGLAVCGFAASPWALAGGRMLAGAGSAVAFVGALYVGSLWFHRGNLALLGAMTTTMGMAGAALGTGTGHWLADWLHWRGAFLFVAGACVLLAVAFRVFIPLRPSWAFEGRERISFWSSMKALGAVLRSRSTWLIGIISLLIYTPISAFGALWGASYLKAALPGISPSVAGWSVSMLFVGLAIAGPLIGKLSDRTGHRNLVLLYGSLAMAVLLVALIFVGSLGVVASFILVFGIGVATSVQAITYAGGMEFHTEDRHSAAIAFVNFAAMMSGLLLQPLIGEILEWQIKSNHSTIESYQIAMISLPVCAVLAAILCVPLERSRRRRAAALAAEAAAAATPAPG
jgi:MFS family permease